MNDNGFKDGTIRYAPAAMTPAELAAAVGNGVWQGGYVAFSRGEKRLAELDSGSITEEFLRGRVASIPGAEGYVAEVNLWCAHGDTIEEISAEREENTFFVQQWALDTKPQDGTGNCWHRKAATVASSLLYTGKLASVEVVWPQYRLNFFITTGGE
jgi:hypothetical protein